LSTAARRRAISARLKRGYSASRIDCRCDGSARSCALAEVLSAPKSCSPPTHMIMPHIKGMGLANPFVKPMPCLRPRRLRAERSEVWQAPPFKEKYAHACIIDRFHGVPRHLLDRGDARRVLRREPGAKISRFRGCPGAGASGARHHSKGGRRG